MDSTSYRLGQDREGLTEDSMDQHHVALLGIVYSIYHKPVSRLEYKPRDPGSIRPGRNHNDSQSVLVLYES